MFYHFFSEYLREIDEPDNFEYYDVPKLADVLRKFYGSVRNKSGDLYSRSGYVSLRAAINRYLTSPPYNKTINIMKDREFMAANQVFTGVLRKMREDGKDTTKHKSAISEGDFRKMYDSGVLSDATPNSLLRKVFVDISLNFGRRGREGLRNLTKDSIAIRTDDKGQEYATVVYNEIDKTHQVLKPSDGEKKQIMYILSSL